MEAVGSLFLVLHYLSPHEPTRAALQLYTTDSTILPRDVISASFLSLLAGCDIYNPTLMIPASKDYKLLLLVVKSVNNIPYSSANRDSQSPRELKHIAIGNLRHSN